MATWITWVAALVTIGSYTYLFGDNPIYRFIEHVFIGLTAAVMTIQAILSIKTQAWIPLTTKGEYLWLLPIVGGIMLLFRLSKRQAWVSRIPLALMLGTATGLSVIRAADTELVRQLRATVVLKWTSVNGAVYITCVILPMIYLIFTTNENTKTGAAVKWVGKVGQYLMMVAFGASLGSTIMARISLAVGRFQFLVIDWLKLGK